MSKRNPIRIKFIGDVSFNNEYIPLLEAGNNPFSEVESQLCDTDLVVGNLECLCEGTGQNKKKIPRINTTDKALNALKYLNLGLVSLATNHVYDNLEKGFENSIRKLNELEIDYLGASTDRDLAAIPTVFEEKGWKVGFLNYVHEDTNPKVPDGAKVYPNPFRMGKIIEDILRLKEEVDRVIVLLHWGGKCDYGYIPHKEQIGHAKAMIDAGASAIVGHHTHTFQASMTYKNAPIYFSLGNFCFDNIVMGKQVFKIRESGRKGGILELKFSDEGQTVASVSPFILSGLSLKFDPVLIDEFRSWNRKFWWVRNVPGLYSLYYYLLMRWEPVHFHAQLNNTTIGSVAINKLKRIIGLR
jgi:hypothetical protein